ncbi:MAG: hypothetical protein GXO79_01870 [Chlorobi bacterium]|nr:hypothetical protein [Chlorobiota bacterium]
MNERELNALIKLLDDPDENIFNSVSEKLISIGTGIIEKLENSWEKSTDALLQSRLESIIQIIQIDSIKEQLKNWKDNKQDDLLEGVFILAKFQYPELRLNTVREKIENIKKEVWIELNNNLTALEKIKVINHVLFSILGFKRNISNPYSPQNAFINDILSTNKGNQVSLSVLYAIISQELSLPVYGVDLPSTFILAYKDDYGMIQSLKNEQKGNILFYINPYNKGAVFGKKEILYFLKQQKIKPLESYYSVCSNAKTLERLIETLIESFEKLGYNEKVRTLNELLAILAA